MSLLNPPVYKEHKSRVAMFTGVALVCAAAIVLYFVFRYYPERKAAEHFFDAVVVGDTDKAYALWKPSGNYKMKDFLQDFGPTGYFGPIKSYKILSVGTPSKTGSMEIDAGKSVEVSVAVSAFAPFPDASNAEESNKTRSVVLWVQPSDKSISFKPGL